MRNKMALAALGLGAAYLMRNKEAREKLMGQFESFGGSSKNKESDMYTKGAEAKGRRKGLLQNM